MTGSHRRRDQSKMARGCQETTGRARPPARKLRTLYVLSLVLLSLFAVATVTTGFAAAANKPVSLSCADGPGGAVYIADSGLTVYEDAPKVTHGSFEDRDTVSFAGTAVSAAGNAARVRLERASGGTTCLAALRPGNSGLTVAPPDAPTVVFESPVSKATFRDPIYAPGEGVADVALKTAAAGTLRLESTGLDAGTTVVVRDNAESRELESVGVGPSGGLAFEVPAGTHSIDLRVTTEAPNQEGGAGLASPTRPASPSETPATTASPTTTATPTPSETAATTVTATELPSERSPTTAIATEIQSETSTTTPTTTETRTADEAIATRAGPTPPPSGTDTGLVPLVGGGPVAVLVAVFGLVAAAGILAGLLRVVE